MNLGIVAAKDLFFMNKQAEFQTDSKSPSSKLPVVALATKMPLLTAVIPDRSAWRIPPSFPDPDEPI
ncbi:MAG: hypothetical protein P8P30_01700 [Rickettsiales bacterium]|nr:hypothetical protein [Rickettsiales bacterium]